MVEKVVNYKMNEDFSLCCLEWNGISINNCTQKTDHLSLVIYLLKPVEMKKHFSKTPTYTRSIYGFKLDLHFDLMATFDLNSIFA